MTRGTVLGFFLGILPGGGAVISSFASYALEKRLSKTPERFGRGAIEGVAGPEAANNAAAGGAFIPLMTLGIPPNVVMALLMGAFIIHGLQPGPLMMSQNPTLFWGIVVSMYIGNADAAWCSTCRSSACGRSFCACPTTCCSRSSCCSASSGSIARANNVFDVYVMIAFGILGYLMRKIGYEPAPLVLAFVLGPMLENNLRKALILSQGELSTFLTRPISAACLLFAAVLLAVPAPPGAAAASARRWRSTRGCDPL